MKLKHLVENESPVILQFGQAQLLKRNGRFELVGGSRDDHTEAKELISLFWHEVIISTPRPTMEIFE
jgi:hypothetical protein